MNKAMHQIQIFKAKFSLGIFHGITRVFNGLFSNHTIHTLEPHLADCLPPGLDAHQRRGRINFVVDIMGTGWLKSLTLQRMDGSIRRMINFVVMPTLILTDFGPSAHPYLFGTRKMTQTNILIRKNTFKEFHFFLFSLRSVFREVTT